MRAASTYRAARRNKRRSDRAMWGPGYYYVPKRSVRLTRKRGPR